MLGVELNEITCDARGFRVDDPAVKARIETIGSTFLHGYDAALADGGVKQLSASLGLVESELRGFAFEGAAMALTLLDHVSARQRSRWKAFVDGPGTPHVYMVHIGAGWAFARLPRGHARLERFLTRCDEHLRWLVVDGYGFHHGFFDWTQTIDQRERPVFSSPYASRAFDQGLGRSLWFVEGADVDRLVARVRTFEPARQADLFSGVGLASAYAGGVDEERLACLSDQAGAELPQVRLGVALAAMTRWNAGNPSPRTSAASKVLCSSSDTELGQLGITLLDEVRNAWSNNVPADPYPNHYEQWRAQLRSTTQRLSSAC